MTVSFTNPQLAHMNSPLPAWTLPLVTQLDPALTEIYAAFGQDTILVPFGDDGCLLEAEELNSITLAYTRTNSYQASLCSSDVAILCGRINGGLCGFSLASPEACGELMGANPGLANTLVTETPSGAILWVRATDCVPQGFRGEQVTWLSDRDAVVLRRRPPWPPDWQASGKEIATVRIVDLNLHFDPGMAVHLIKADAEHWCGPPFLPGRWGRKIFNPKFWAGFAGSIMAIRYFSWDRRFERFDPEAREWRSITEELLMHKLCNFISGESKLLGHPVLPGLKMLRLLVGELRIQCVQEDVDQPLGVARFLVDHVEPCPGQDMTTRELHAAYCQHQSQADLPAISQPVFEQLIGPALAARWGLRRSHSLLRDDRAKCGYRGIRLKAGCPPPAGPGGLGGLGGGVSLARERIEPDSVLSSCMPTVKVPP